MKLDRSFKLLIFIFLWILIDFLFNRYLFQIPFFGSLNRFVEISHWIAFGILGLFCGITESTFWTLSLLSWAIGDELLQTILPNRICDYLDIVRNIVGFWSGYFIAFILRKMPRI